MTTTAREQARKAATELPLSTPYQAGLAGADVASDVWEPLCRDLYEMLRDSTPGPLPEDAPVRALLQRAKEMLGE